MPSDASRPSRLCFAGAALLSVGVLLFATVMFAQTESATLSGTVLDRTGAVIPGAQVQATNSDTNVTAATVTNHDGIYVIPALKPGRYRVSVTKQGFKQVFVTDVILNVQDTISRNFNLDPGAVSESITVTSNAAELNTTDATVSTVVDRQFVENMPLNGRTFQSLIALSPGVTLVKSTEGNSGQFSVNGQRTNANYFSIDGVSANIGVTPDAAITQTGAGSLPGLSAAGGTNNLISVDAMQEFKVLTSTYAPEYGRSPGAQISIVSRSGTNAFHGTVFDYFRNDVLDANDWFADHSHLAKPALRQNDFGGVFGGPLYLPLFDKSGPRLYSGKNRTFFFFSYEGLRLRQPLTTTTQVPSIASRQSAIPAIQPFLNAFPLPTGANTLQGLAVMTASYSNPTTLDAASLRLDHSVNSRLTIFARYNYAPSNTVTRGLNGGVLSQISPTIINTQTATAGATYSISSRIIDDFRANWSASRGQEVNALDSFGGAVPIPDADYFPSTFTGQRNFTFSLTTVTYQKGGFANNSQEQRNFTDSVSLAFGTHQIKIGTDFRRLIYHSRPLHVNGQAIFNGATGALNGQIFRGSITSTGGPKDVGTDNLSLYAQDTWRAAQRLTLTYGLRWDLDSYPDEAHGLDPVALTGLSDPSTIALAPPGTPLWQTRYGNFAPRLGVAYQLRQTKGHETVFRAGYGIFYDLPYGSLLGAFSNSWPSSVKKNLAAKTQFPYTTAIATPPAITATLPATNVIVADPQLKLPLTHQWNVALEQALGASQSLSLSYIGAAGRQLLRQEQLVNPNPNFVNVFITRNDASSDYHALQAQFNRRLANNLEALASYTWSHAIDDASNDATAFAPSARIAPNTDRSSSDFDIRHSFRAAITYMPQAPDLGRVANSILQHWSIDPMFTARSATPVNVFTTTDILGLGLTSISRPDLVPGVPLYLSDASVAGGMLFNRAAFSIPPANSLRQGTLGRNALRGFAVYQVDLALRREFPISDRLKLQFGGELFNLFNHPNFGDPDGNLGTNAAPNAFFGQSTAMLGRTLGSGGVAGGLNPLYQVGGPRSIQLSAKILF